MTGQVRERVHGTDRGQPAGGNRSSLHPLPTCGVRPIFGTKRRISRLGGLVAAPQQRIGDFYDEVVLPALVARLDAAFPEFGWRQDARGWVATNQEMTHRVLGVRADRVVAHGSAPPGFLVHGGETMLWTAYVNGGDVPRGETFRSVVRELAARAGVDTSPIDRSQPRDRSKELLDDFFRLCRRRVARQGGRARALVSRATRFPARARSIRSSLGSFPASCSRRTRSRRRAIRSSRSRSRACSQTVVGPGGSAAHGETSVDGSGHFGLVRSGTPTPPRATSTSAERAAQACRRTA